MDQSSASERNQNFLLTLFRLLSANTAIQFLIITLVLRFDLSMAVDRVSGLIFTASNACRPVLRRFFAAFF